MPVRLHQACHRPAYGITRDHRAGERRPARSRGAHRQPEYSHPFGYYSASLVAAGLELRKKSSSRRHDDVASLQITNHQAILPLDQMQRDQEAQTGIQAVLIALAW